MHGQACGTGLGTENVGNLQGTLGRALGVPGWDRVQGRGVSLEPLWLTGSLLVSSTLGLAEKRGQEGGGEGQEGGRKGRKEEEKETCTHFQAHNSP